MNELEVIKELDYLIKQASFEREKFLAFYNKRIDPNSKVADEIMSIFRNAMFLGIETLKGKVNWEDIDPEFEATLLLDTEHYNRFVKSANYHR